MSECKLTGEVVKEYLTKFPNTPSLTLARLMYRDNVSLFTNIDHARSAIRYYRGANGDHNRKSLTDHRFINHELQHT